MRAVIASVIAVLSLAAVTGCQPGVAAGPALSSSDTGQSLHDVPAVSPPATGAVLATGVMVDASGAPIGEVTIAHLGHTRVTVTSTAPTREAPAFDLQASPHPVDVGDCFDSGWRLGVGPASESEFVVPTGIGSGDLSFLDAIVLVEGPPPGGAEAWAASGCLARASAVAPLTWAVPDQRPGLIVEDAGATSGASGTVGLDADGAPASYTVARNDVMAVIARRFGITEADIRYLNPTRFSVCGGTEVACAEEVLNLSKTAR